MIMGLHKPSNIKKLNEILAEEASSDNDIRQILENVDNFGTKKVDKQILQHLSQTESHYPVVPVEDKYYLLAENSKNFKALI